MNVVIVRMKNGQAYSLRVAPENSDARFIGEMPAHPAPYHFADLIQKHFGDELESVRVLPFT